MRDLLRMLLVAVAASTFVSPVTSAGLVWISQDLAGVADPLIPVGNNQFVTLYVLADSWGGEDLSSIKLAIPTPPGLMIISAAPPPSSGSLETGAVIPLGCVTDRTVVMSLVYFTTNVDSCVPLRIHSYQSMFGFELEGADCDGNPVRVEKSGITFVPAGADECGNPTVPANPSPPDGALDVSLTPTLTWESEPTAGTGLGVFEMRLHLGTTPDPPLFHAIAFPPFDLGPLQPYTTYYWKISSHVYDLGFSIGPVWSFTTTALTPVRTSTWGAIKAMYR